MKRIVLTLEDADAAKLKALASASNITEQQALLRFIRACVPEGSGWTHPMAAAKRSPSQPPGGTK